MNNELLAFEHAYDDIKAKYDALRESHKKLEQSLKEMTAENTMMKDELEKTKEKLKEMIGQRDNLYGAYNHASEKLEELDSRYRKLLVENQQLKDDHYILKDKNKWATPEEAKEFIDSIQQAPLKLGPILSETPSVVINTKSINITFDNHTNNFKEDDAE